MKKPVVLVVDDEDSVRETLRIILKDQYEVLTASDVAVGLEALESNAVDIILMDVNLPGTGGIEALDRIKRIDSEVGTIMISASDSAHQAVSALKKGAFDYITKPFDNEDLLLTLKRCTERVRLKSEVAYLKEELREKTGCGEIISKAPSMRNIFNIIDKLRATASNVLITGESGTGKELVARAIHYLGDRRNKPFVAVNCGAIPSELMESELFGHEKGAFTGALHKKIGKFEFADGGSLFLDEVCTLPMHLQIKLLRVLQEKSFERVGSNYPITVDIRVIAASNADLENAVREGVFREDLYYRLKVVPIELPPLRKRKEDIPLLIQHFLEKHGRRCNKKITGITPQAVAALIAYGWPGNVRELENLVERLVVLAREGAEIGYEDIPSALVSDLTLRHDDESKEFKDACRSFERHYIVRILNKTNWNRIEAAKRMKIHRNTLLMKMKELGIRPPRTGSNILKKA